MKYKSIEQVEKFSHNILNKIRSELKNKLTNSNISTITTGSFARKEASTESDLDFLCWCKMVKMI